MPATLRSFVATILFTASFLTSASGQEMSLKASGELQWRKGNMHTHSYWSDGDNYPEMIAAWYKERSYNFLVFTDHNTLHQNEKWIDVDKAKEGRKSLAALQAAFPTDWIVSRKSEGKEEVRLKTFDEVFTKFAVPQQYLLIQGEEITDKFFTVNAYRSRVDGASLRLIIDQLWGLESCPDVASVWRLMSMA